MKPSQSAPLKYVPSKTAEQFHSGKGLFRGLMGPIGAGKSVACCWELFRLACAQKPFNGVRKSRWGVIRATYSELISTTIRTWSDWFPEHMCPLKMHEAPIRGHMVIPLPDGTTLDMELFFAATEREEDTRKLLGMELTGVWFNEARELPWGVVRDAMSRMGRYPAMREGGHTRKAAIADTNPPDSDHWWYKLDVDRRLTEDAEPITDDDFQFFRQPSALVRMEQGYVPNQYAENIKNLKDGYRYYTDMIPGRDPEWINVYILGEYGTVMDGKPVYGKAFNSTFHLSKVNFLPIPGVPIVIALDFGRTPAVVFGQQSPRGQVRVLEEIITEDSDIRAVARGLIKPKILTTYKDCPIYITGDPAGGNKSEQESQSCYDILQEELKGLYRDMTPAVSNDPTLRQDSVRKLLFRLHDGVPGFQVAPQCKTLVKAFLGGYKYKTIRMGGGQMRTSTIPDKNMFSHVSDACQYLCMYLLGGLADSIGASVSTINRPSYTAADPVAGY